MAIKAVKISEFERVIVDSTVQEKAIAHPTDSRLLEVAREKVARLARRAGIKLKQTREREGKTRRRRAVGYAHAKQFKRLKRVLCAGEACLSGPHNSSFLYTNLA